MDPEGGHTGAPDLAGVPASGTSTMPPITKHKSFAPHIPRNNGKNKKRMRGALSSLGPTEQSNHKFQDDESNQSNHKFQHGEPNARSSNKPKEFHKTAKRSKYCPNYSYPKKLHETLSSPGLTDQSKRECQNDDSNQSNHEIRNSDSNTRNSIKAKEFHQSVKRSKHHHNSTNPKESNESLSPSERAAIKRSCTWHRQQQSMQDRVEENKNNATVEWQHQSKSDITRVEGQRQSKEDISSMPQDVSSNKMQFNGPKGSFSSYPLEQDIQSQRDNCYKLWKQLNGAHDARERHIYMKEEELAKREQAVKTQEEIIAHWRAQAQDERLEAAYMRQEAYSERLRVEEEAKILENLRADIERIRNDIFSRHITNESCKDGLKTHDRAKSFHVKMESQIDYNDPERISGQLGDDANNDAVQHLQCRGEMRQNYLNTLKTNADENLEAMGDPSQSCADTSQAKLDISAKAHEHSMRTMELWEVSSSEVTSSNVSEKGHVSQQQYDNGVFEEIVTRSLEIPVICAADRSVIEYSESHPSKLDIVDVCQDGLRFSSSVSDKDNSLQLSSQRKDNSKLSQLPASQCLVHAETLTCKETEVPLNNAECSMPMPIISTFPVKVKVENVEHEQVIPLTAVTDNFANASMQKLKVNSKLFEDYRSDDLDHLSLQERKKLCKATLFNMDVDTNLPPTNNSQAGEFDSGEAWKEKARSFNLKKTKKKTKTCSYETALEEDAPGLLEVLREKGVMEEIKLYGDFVDENLLGLAADENNFKDLETVIEKLWGQPSGLFKMVRMRQATSKPTYCLSCLLSLIEQTRSLQNRKWPVEWGWCRQLQLFIFVFERHNRIVLERPEYGYATYFFELVQSLPIMWQVGRLVTVMSIAICGRTAVLENKPLEIGQDLTAEEAKILEDYGWTPNSGIGSLLNYCDRVVHDRKVEDDDMEWRSKIGKLLMDGHASGRIVIDNIPKKLQSGSPIIKIEECQ